MSSTRHAFSTSSGLLVLILFASVLLAGCDSNKFDSGSPRSDDQPPLSPNVRMKISFDQAEVTYSNVLPPGVVGDVGGAQSNAQSKSDIQNKGVMESYEATHETWSYDKKGYLTRTYTHTDGWQGLNMPEASFNDLKAQMPRRAPKNPITKFKLEGGTIQFISKNGKVTASASVDPAEFRLAPPTLDSLEALQEDTQTDQRTDQMRRRLQARGLALNTLSEHHVAFETQSEEKGLSNVRRVIDLRTGQPVYLAYYKENGRLARVKTRTYRRYTGVPVMRHETSYKYGIRDGRWTVVSRTETRRRNISVQFD